MVQEKRAKLLSEEGFTLIEIMVVVVILSILAAMIVPRIMDRPDQARLVRAQQDIMVIVNSLKLYKLDNFTYPTTTQGLAVLIEGGDSTSGAKRWKEGGYIDRLPVDPWGHSYQYLYPGIHGPFDVYSFGADGQMGGEGMNADIGNWDLE